MRWIPKFENEHVCSWIECVLCDARVCYCNGPATLWGIRGSGGNRIEICKDCAIKVYDRLGVLYIVKEGKIQP